MVDLRDQPLVSSEESSESPLEEVHCINDLGRSNSSQPLKQRIKVRSEALVVWYIMKARSNSFEL